MSSPFGRSKQTINVYIGPHNGGPKVRLRRMFRGLSFMVNDQMCISVSGNDLLCRIGETRAAKELEKDHCRQAVMGGRPMEDFVYVDGTDVRSGKTHPSTTSTQPACPWLLNPLGLTFREKQPQWAIVKRKGRLERLK